MNATESLLMVLDNDAKAYRACIKLADWAAKNGETIAADSDGVWDKLIGPEFWLSERIQDYVETICDDAGAGCGESASLIVAQLFNHALQSVVWDEVAQHYLAKIAEGVTL
jgi:hypothetical protein